MYEYDLVVSYSEEKKNQERIILITTFVIYVEGIQERKIKKEYG
jgi:hypothetical protein